jgi:hypothetical protein
MPKESRLEIKTLANGVAIPSLDGVVFCASRDPISEAQKWFKAIERSCEQHEEIVVLGLGAGFHLLPLLQLNKKIYVYEIQSQLVHAWPLKEKIQFIPEDFQTQALVLEFRPSWSGNEKKYTEISRRLRGNEALGLKRQAEMKDLWILAQALETSLIPENLEISIKEIVGMIPIDNQSEEARMWRALRELVV